MFSRTLLHTKRMKRMMIVVMANGWIYHTVLKMIQTIMLILTEIH